MSMRKIERFLEFVQSGKFLVLLLVIVILTFIVEEFSPIVFNMFRMELIRGYSAIVLTGMLVFGYGNKSKGKDNYHGER